MKKSLAFPLIFSGLILLFISCGSKPSQNDKTDPKKDTETLTNKDKTDAKKDTVTLTNSVIFIDGSVSMQGYLSPDKQSNFAAVVSALEGITPQSCIEYIYKDSKEEIRDNTLSTAITNKKLNLNGQESDIKLMLSDMIAGVKADSTSIYWLVTDGILSASNEQIKKHKEYGKVYAEKLSNDIANVLNVGKGKVAAIVMQFEAPFKGKYSAYDNSTIKLNNDIRPYYVIGMAIPPIAKQVFDKIQKGEFQTLKNYRNMALFGFDYDLDNPFIETENGVSQLDDEYRILSQVKALELAYNVSSLPSRMLDDIDALKSNVRIFTKNENDSFELNNGEQYEVDYLDGNLKIKIKDKDDLYIPGDLEIGISWWQPKWIKTMTSFDDKKLEPGTTFNLNYLLQPFSILNAGGSINYIDQPHVIRLTN